MKQGFGKKIGKTGKYWKFLAAGPWPRGSNVNRQNAQKIPKNSLKLTKMGENLTFSPKIVTFSGHVSGLESIHSDFRCW